MITLTVFCAGLMVFTFQIPRAAAAGTGGGGSGVGNNSTGPLVYPYAIPTTAYPNPSVLVEPAPLGGVAAIPLPGELAGYGVLRSELNNSVNGTGSTLLFSELQYSPVDAEEVEENGSCGPACGQLPLNWSSSATIATFPDNITGEGLGSMGAVLLAAVTSDDSTSLYEWAGPPNEWTRFGPSLAGQFQSLATTPLEAAVATLTGGRLLVSSLTATGSLISSTAITPSGAAASVLAAGVSFVPTGPNYTEVAVFSVTGVDQIQSSWSPNGVAFTPPEAVVNFTANGSNYPLSSVGMTALNETGGWAGQLALTSVGAQLFLLFTTNLSGQTVPATMSSGNAGVNWSGPFFTGPINGTAVNPAVTVGPTGAVFATWENPRYDSGSVEAATYFPDGPAMVPPTMILGSSANGVSPVGAPAAAVDGFDRPIVLWPSLQNSSGVVAYTGAYLSPATAIDLTEQTVSATLGAPDLVASGPDASSALDQLAANLSTIGQQIVSNLSAGHLCAAQALTTGLWYQNVTHFPLAIAGGTGTVCAPVEVPSASASPILPEIGVNEPNIYLAVYSDWALESESVEISASPLGAVAAFSPYTEVVPSATLPVAVQLNETVDGQTVWATETPTPYSPTAYDLALADQFPTWTHVSSARCSLTGGGWGTVVVTETTTVNQTWSNVTVDHGPVHSFNGTAAFPSVWVYGLDPYQSYEWSATLSARTSETQKTVDSCDHETTTTVVSPVTFGPGAIPALVGTGAFSTTLSATYGSSFVTAAYTRGRTAADLTTSFGTTLPATVSSALSNSTGSQSWNTSTFGLDQSYSFPQMSGVNVSYTLSLTSTSRSGSNLSPGPSSFSIVTPATSSPAETVWAACSFTLTSGLPAVTVAPGGPYWANDTTTMDLSWFSNESAPGFFTYHANGSAINTTISGITPVRAGPGLWNYTIEVHGLEPGQVYNGTYGVSWAQGCLTDQDGVSTQTFTAGSDPAKATKPVVVIQEQDLPYDSVTHSGGGIRVSWTNPTKVGTKGVVTSGAATVAGGGLTWVVPFTRSQVWQPAHSKKSYPLNELNLTLTLNRSTFYTLSLEVNYSTYASGPLYSQAGYGFPYESASSRDGLTNAEKQSGWDVAIQPCGANSGASNLCGDSVTANVGFFSSNGLANDYLEKELDLNPKTLDTAGSDMLDLWNLTFSLQGRNGVRFAVPVGIVVSWENTTYVPFDAPIYPGGLNPGGEPNFTGLGNLSCTGNQTCPGNSSWSAEGLWSYSALDNLTNSSGYRSATAKGNYLRAEGGRYDGAPVITLWGKLSWGANPHMKSTVGDAVPDGARVNPVDQVDLQLNITWVTVQSEVSYPFNWAVGFYVNGSTEAGSPAVAEFHNYSYETETFALGSNTTNFQAALPVNDSYQFQALSLSVVGYLKAGSGYSLQTITTSNDCNAIPVTYDMLAGEPLVEGSNSLSCDAWPSSSAYSAMGITVSDVIVGTKDPTYLLQPSGNGTVINVTGAGPEYIGEQAFDLIIVNVTTDSPVTSSPIPVPWSNNSSYQLTFGPGPNAILVPRGEFLNSSLGSALFRDRAPALANNTTPEPLTGGNNSAAIQGLISTDGDPALRFLSCYWQDRALPDVTEVSYGTGGGESLLCGSETGVGQQPSSLVQVYADNGSASARNGGGLPSSPDLEGSELAGAALQDIITINVTNSTNEWGGNLGPVPALNLILAGLLDNYTGGVNGTIVNVTANLSGLGLDSVVLAALPNASVVSSGLYAAPGPVSPTGSGKGCSWLGCLYQTAQGLWNWWWNGGLETAVLGWLGSIEDFFENLPHLASRFLISLIADAFDGGWLTGFSVLEGLYWDAGVALVRAFTGLLNLITNDVLDPILDPILNWILSTMGGYDSAISAGINASIADVVDGGTYIGAVSLAHAHETLQAIGGNVMEFGVVLGGAVLLVSVVVAALSGGAAFVVDDILAGFTLGGAAAVAGLAVAGSLTTTAITQADSWVSANHSPNSGQPPQADWTALSEVVGDGLDFSSLPLDIYLGVKLAESKNPAARFAYPIVSIALDFAAIALDSVAWAAPHLLPLAIVAIVISAVALAVSLRTPPVTGFEWAGEIGDLIATLALGPAVYDLVQDLV